MNLRTSRYIEWMLILFLAVVMVPRTFGATRATVPGVEQRPTCAVLTFDTGKGMHTSQAALLANRYAVLVARTGRYKVLSRYRTNQILLKYRFNRAAYKSSTAAAIAAGKVLNVQYVIFGSVEKKGERYTLDTSLLEVESRKIIKRVRSYYDGELDNFMKLAPASNLKRLLDLKEIPPAVIKPPVPVPEPPEPKIEEVEPAKPEPPEVTPEPEIEFPELEEEVRIPGWRLPELLQKCPEYWERTTELLSGQVEVGTRITGFRLLTKTRGSFLGSIDSLDAKGDNIPNKLFVDWYFTPRYGIEVTWDRVEAATITTDDGHCDGSIVLAGPIITVFERRRIDMMIRGRALTLTPYAGMGLAILNGSFEHTGWWHHGFSADTWQDAERSYNEWVAEGSPPWPNDGYQRTMNFDDTMGFVLTAGCAAEVAEKLSIDLYLRYMDVDVDDEYTLSSYGEVFQTEKVTFPMSNYAFGLGVRYAF